MSTYQITPTADRTLSQLPDDWSAADYRTLLDRTDYGDTADLSESELREMAYLSVADLARPEAAGLLLDYRCGELLETGQIQNAQHEMEDEKLWEEYPDMAAHCALFSAGSFLYAAFNGGFPKPEARELTLTVAAKNDDAADALRTADPALLLRLLAPGMDAHALLHRLFEAQLQGTRFPEAEHILWQTEVTETAKHTFTVKLLSSAYWLEDYRPVDEYEAKAWPDEVPTEA